MYSNKYKNRHRFSYAPYEIAGFGANKFHEGFLNGIGDDTQFRSQSQRLPILPASANDDQKMRIAEANGTVTGGALEPWYAKALAFEAGTGTEALRSGICNTLPENAGLDPITGRFYTQVFQGHNPANDPIEGYNHEGVGSYLVTKAPAVLVGGEGPTFTQSFVKAEANHSRMLKRRKVK